MRSLMRSLTLGTLAMALACSPSGRDADTSAAEYETRTSAGDISFRLTPRRSEGRLIVDIQADTHSGDLSEVNLRNALVLRADGRSYMPVAATALAGHHAEGSVTFEVPDAMERFSIAVASVRGMEELTFEWP